MTAAVELKIGSPEAGALQAGVVLAKAAGTQSFRAGWELLLETLGGSAQELAGSQEAGVQGNLTTGAADAVKHGSATGMAWKAGETWPMPVTGQLARKNIQESELLQPVAGEHDLVQKNLPDATQRDGTFAESKLVLGRDAEAATEQTIADPLQGTGAPKTRTDRSASRTEPPAARRTERRNDAQSSAAAAATAAQVYVPPASAEVLKMTGTEESKASADRNSVASRMIRESDSLTPEGSTQEATGVGQLAAIQPVHDSEGTSARIDPAEGEQDQRAIPLEEGPVAAGAGQSARKSSLYAAHGLGAEQEAPVGGKGMPDPVTGLARQGLPAASSASDLQDNTVGRASGSATADAAMATGASASAQTQRSDGARNVARTGVGEQAVTAGNPIQNVAEPAGRKEPAINSASFEKATNSAAVTHPDKSTSLESPAKQRDVTETDRATRASSLWAGGHLQETHLATVQAAIQPSILSHPAQVQSAGAAASGASRQGSPASAAATSTGGTNPDAFSTLDAATAPAATWSHGSVHRAEAGFQDPSLGWVSVRAETGTSGIHASVVASTADAAQALSGHMAGLATHLAEHRTPVETLTFSSSGGQSSGTGADRDANQNMQQNEGRAPYSNQRAQAASGSVTEARTKPRFAEEAARAPVWDSGSGGGRISVMA